MNKRGSGILLHITSLPSPYGIGDLGEEAYRFVDFLAQANQKYWQILPLNPTETVLGNSPYSSCSAFAGNPLLISPRVLVQEHFLEESDLKDCPSFESGRVNYPLVTEFKTRILKAAFQRFKKKTSTDKAFLVFCKDNAYWLEDYSLFRALKNEKKGLPWNEWEPALRDRDPAAITQAQRKLAKSVLREKFFQYLFYRQWFALKKYCGEKDIQIIGDVPIYVHYDSVDVWSNAHLFKLDKNKNMEFLSGVPPDYFSATGQLWGNPVYRWSVSQKNRYSWWKKRFSQNFKYFDIIRIDHFRGFVAFWEVPRGETTAVHGKWIKVPAEDFFKEMVKYFGVFSIIAEDLGYITDDVKKTISKFHFPGMKVLLFAFGGDISQNPYVPHNHIRNCVLYTGTHDNNTARGWFDNEASAQDKDHLRDYFGRDFSSDAFVKQIVRIAMMSVADRVIFPIQDILGLGQAARMNRPGTLNDNWAWRLLPEQLNMDTAGELSRITKLYARHG